MQHRALKPHSEREWYETGLHDGAIGDCKICTPDVGPILDHLGNPHEAGCPAVADDESDYECLTDAGYCVCKYRGE